MYSPCRELIVSSLCLLVLSGCKREEREFEVNPPMASVASTVQTTDLIAGAQPATKPASISSPQSNDDVEHNAFQLSEGQQLFDRYNCSTCHAHGGGDIGPPLLDEKWIYGYEPQQVYASIVQGRPNGMPAYGSRLTQQQVWQLTGYVRSMSGQTSQQARPGRKDEMQVKVPENTVSTTQPLNSTP
jgi:cytochrome c oxidase cbb3-type subunit 3